MAKLCVTDSALEYLAKFCSERSEGRSGSRYWDAFLAHAMSNKACPEPADIHSWLQENLQASEQIDSLVEDYERILRISEQSKKLGERKTTVSLFKADEAVPELWRAASSAFESLAANAVSANIPAGAHYVPASYKRHHEATIKQLSQTHPTRSFPLGKLLRGKHSFSWEQNQLTLAVPPELRERNPHVLVVGKKGQGKTRFMARAATQDILTGDRAVVLVDSAGTMTSLILNWIDGHSDQARLRERVILLDPTQPDKTSYFNPFESLAGLEDKEVAAAVVSAFRAIRTEVRGSQNVWNAQSANILRNSVLLLLANNRTLADVPKVLTDVDFRDTMLETIENVERKTDAHKTLLETWSQYKRLARTDQWIGWVEPLLNRLGPAMADPRINSLLVNQGNTNINLKQAIEEKRIILLNQANHQLDENGQLLGSLMVNGLARIVLLGEEDQRGAVSLYVDGLKDLVDESTVGLIAKQSGTRPLQFVGSVETLQFLPEDVRHLLLVSVHVLACFAVTERDAEQLSPQMFRVDGRLIKKAHFSGASQSPFFVLVSEQEHHNMRRLMSQNAREFFCYFVGTIAGIAHVRSSDFGPSEVNADTPESALV